MHDPAPRAHRPDTDAPFPSRFPNFPPPLEPSCSYVAVPGNEVEFNTMCRCLMCESQNRRHLAAKID